jgi:hypothetical protein
MGTMDRWPGMNGYGRRERGTTKRHAVWKTEPAVTLHIIVVQNRSHISKL